MNSRRSRQLVRVLVLLAFAAALWSIAIDLSGGFRLRVGPVLLTAHDPRRASAVAILACVVLVLLPEGRRMLREAGSRCLGAGRRTAAALISVVNVLSAAAPVLPIIVCAAGIALDLYQWAGALPLWLDEEMIAINIRDRSLAELTGPLWLEQAAPFGWLAAQKAVMLVLGTGERALRFTSLLFGIATLLTALWVGRRWMGWLAATVLVLVCSVHQQLSHFRFEVKHYAADAFWAFLLPALAARTMEALDAPARTRRWMYWWAAAAAGHWFANGALLVVPPVSAVLAVAIWRRDGIRCAARFALAGLIWLASVGLHYQASLGATHGSASLHRIWASAFPPAGAGSIEIARWLWTRLPLLANDPGGTQLWVALWLSAVCGFLAASPRLLGAVFAVLPIGAFVLGLRVVPLYGRFALWVAPALLVGVALLIDGAVRLSQRVWRRPWWAWPALVVSALILLAEYRLVDNIVRRGVTDLEIPTPRHKHSLDDRAAVRWLMQHRRPGDAIITTRLGWPAVWWYGGSRPPQEDGIGSRLTDGAMLYELTYRTPDDGCPAGTLSDLAARHDRALVYLGFQDVPTGFDRLAVSSFNTFGGITSASQFSDLGLAFVVDFRAPPPGQPLEPHRLNAGEAPTQRGCVAVQAARRW